MVHSHYECRAVGHQRDPDVWSVAVLSLSLLSWHLLGKYYLSGRLKWDLIFDILMKYNSFCVPKPRVFILARFMAIMLACSLKYPTDRSTSSASVPGTHRARHPSLGWVSGRWAELAVKHLAALIPSNLTLVASLLQSGCSCCLPEPADGGWWRHLNVAFCCMACNTYLVWAP